VTLALAEGRAGPPNQGNLWRACRARGKQSPNWIRASSPKRLPSEREFLYRRSRERWEPGRDNEGTGPLLETQCRDPPRTSHPSRLPVDQHSVRYPLRVNGRIATRVARRYRCGTSGPTSHATVSRNATPWSASEDDARRGSAWPAAGDWLTAVRQPDCNYPKLLRPD
jgi:hypothetical protein